MSDPIEIIEVPVETVEVLESVTEKAELTQHLGSPGMSAYAIAVLNGFSGTEEQWLETLKGEKGDTGPQGMSAYQSAVASGYQGTLDQWLASLRGPVGPIGPQGVRGLKGDTGNQGDSIEFNWDGTQLGLRVGGHPEFDYVDLKGDKGDIGIGLVYQWSNTSLGLKREDESTFTFIDLKGEKGNQGIQGIQGIQGESFEYQWSGSSLGVKRTDEATYTYSDLIGPQGIQGIQGEKGNTGEKGDKGDVGDTGLSAYEVAASQGFVGSEVDWLNSLVGPQGEKGDKGDTGTGLEYLWNGTELGVRAVGDATYTFANLIGPQGIQGEIGPQGIQGIQGPQGEQGIQGIKGDTGDPGPQGIQGPQGEKGDKGDPGTTDYSGLVNIPTEFNPSQHVHPSGDISDLGKTYGAHNQDPDLAATHIILSNHANTPDSRYYWHITTTFYSAVANTSNRAQVAVQYNGGCRVYARSTYGGNWEPWTRCDQRGNRVLTSNLGLAEFDRAYVAASGRMITLPANPSDGCEVYVTVGDFSDTTLLRNGENIMGLAEDFVIDKPLASIGLRYVNSTYGWRII